MNNASEGKEGKEEKRSKPLKKLLKEPLNSLEKVIEGEFIGMATVGDKGQIVLPIEVRRELGIGTGDKLMVYLRKDRGQLRLMKAELVTALMNRALGEIEDLQRLVQSVQSVKEE